MSEDSAISQDEIDALLAEANPAPPPDMAALLAFAKGAAASFASGLQRMTGAQFQAGEPAVEALNRERFTERLPDTVVAVTADFSAGLSGDHIYVLSTELAQKLADLVNKEEKSELDDMALSIVSEAVTLHTDSELSALAKSGKYPGVACAPAQAAQSPKTAVRCPPNLFTLFSYPLTLEGTQYTLWEAVSQEAADGMRDALTSAPAPSAAAPGAAAGAGGQGQSAPSVYPNTPNVHGLEFPPLQQGGPLSAGEQANIGLLMDVFMEMTVELGRTKKPIKDILQMGEGTIIELDKLAGEPVDILVNHKPIAKGEVVVIDENFGVRVTEILSPMERVSDLQY